MQCHEIAVLCCGGSCDVLGVDVLYGLSDVIHGNDGKDRTKNLADLDNAQVSETN